MSGQESNETRIVRATLRLARALRQSAPAIELTGGALALIATLYRKGPLSAVALARCEGLQPQSLSRLLARLEADALIKRAVDPDDRRCHVITLTPRGRGALDWAMTQRRQWLATAMADLSQAERATLLAAADIMLKIADPWRRNTMAPIDRPKLTAAEPQVYVQDIGVASAFYCEKLGFELMFSYGEPPFYAQVRRDGARLDLRRVRGPVFATGFRATNEDALAAVITVDGIEGLFSSYDSAEVELHQRLRHEPWGARTFIVCDPDRNLICFAGE